MSETQEAPVQEPETPAPPVSEQPAAETPPEPPQDETAALKRRLAEEERARKRLEAAQKKAEEAKAAEQGEWQKLAEQREAELKAATERSEAIQREQLIARVASRMKFVDPSDVIGRVPAEDGTDESTVQAALERIAVASPHLVQKEVPATPEIGQVLTPSASPSGVQPPPGKAPLRTLADVEALPDSEFNERYAEVQAVLKNPQ